MAGKKLRNAYKTFDREKIHTLEEAIAVIKQHAKAKFDESVEIAMNLNVDARKAEQNIRGVVQLPHGTGKTYRVAVFAKGPKAEEAKAAGADIVGAEDLVAMIQKGDMPFDRCIATPDMMLHVGKVGKILGPRGLMPNPKLGTVTMDVAGAVKAVKGSQVEYRTEKAGLVHAGVGKVSFADNALLENIKTFLSTIQKVRPAGVKGTYIKRMSLSSTMGVGVKFEVAVD